MGDWADAAEFMAECEYGEMEDERDAIRQQFERASADRDIGCGRRKIVADRLEEVRARLPTISEMSGSDPDYTGDLTTAEYMDALRGVEFLAGAYAPRLRADLRLNAHMLAVQTDMAREAERRAMQAERRVGELEAKLQDMTATMQQWRTLAGDMTRGRRRAMEQLAEVNERARMHRRTRSRSTPGAVEWGGGRGMRIYLASSYRRRVELQGYADDLRACGHTVTSRWLDGSHDSCDDATPSDEERGNWALEDLDDIRGSDALILFTGGELIRGGCMVELGYALGIGLLVFAVGPRVNVFCCMPRVEWFGSWARAMAYLADCGGTDAEAKARVAW